MGSARNTRVVSLSLSPDDTARLDALAAEEGRNRSELVREMLRIYEAYRETGRFDAIQRYGAQRARAAGVRDEADIARLLAERSA